MLPTDCQVFEFLQGGTLVKKLTLLVVTTSSLTLTLTSCISSGGASSSSASSSSSAMHWNLAAFPLNIKASTDFDVTQRTLLNDMAVEWEDLGIQGDASDDEDFFSASPGGTLSTVVDPNYSNINSYRDNTLGIYLLNNWPDSFSSSALAVTQLWGVRGDSGISLSHWDIFFNNDLYSFYTDPAGAGDDANAYDMGTVALHELGHSIGLNHISNVPADNAVMYPYLGINTVKRELRDCDLRAISDNYNFAADATLCPEIESLESDHNLGLNPMNAGITEAALDEAGVSVGDDVGIVMELRVDGSCHHIVNGHDVYSHKANLNGRKLNQEDVVNVH